MESSDLPFIVFGRCAHSVHDYFLSFLKWQVQNTLNNQRIITRTGR